MYMMDDDVESICERLARNANPTIVSHALILAEWVHVINTHSDGWAYWAPGRNAANQLLALLAKAAGAGSRENRDAYYDGERFVPTDAQFAKALAPMKSIATRKNLPSPLAPLERIAARVAARAKEIADQAAMVAMTITGQPMVAKVVEKVRKVKAPVVPAKLAQLALI